MALKALQDELGVRLFERVGRRNGLTREGRALLERAGPLLEQWEALPGQIQQTAQEDRTGRVRVGAGEGAVLYLLPAAIRAFKRRWPKVEVIVRNQARNTLACSRPRLDFALRASPPRPPAPLRPFRASRAHSCSEEPPT